MDWILDSLRVRERVGDPSTFFMSVIFSVLIILIVYQLQREIREIKAFLKIKGFIDKGGVVERMLYKTMGKKGYMIDARILLIILALAFLYAIIRYGIFG